LRKGSKKAPKMDEKTVEMLSEADRLVYMKLLDDAESLAASTTTSLKDLGSSALREVPRDRLVYFI
jgi:hypothetical protein